MTPETCSGAPWNPTRSSLTTPRFYVHTIGCMHTAVPSDIERFGVYLGNMFLDPFPATHRSGSIPDNV